MPDVDATPAWFTLLAAWCADHDEDDIIILMPPGYYPPHRNPPRDTTAVQ